MKFKITKKEDMYYLRNTITNEILPLAYYSYESAKEALFYRTGIPMSMQNADKLFAQRISDCISIVSGVRESYTPKMVETPDELDVDDFKLLSKLDKCN